MKLFRRSLNFLRRLLKKPWKKSYAQSGEDLIVAFLLADILQIAKPTYLDIGAHHPYEINNTYFFYKLGFRGVCVEANPKLIGPFKRWRRRDACLNVGVGDGSTNRADFYVMNLPSLSTFSKKERDSYTMSGYSVKKVIQVDLVSINAIIAKYYTPFPNFVSLDTEGYDESILQSFDFTRFRPEVFCIETVDLVTGQKLNRIDQIMVKNGYHKYADTFINTIYVEEAAFNRYFIKA